MTMRMIHGPNADRPGGAAIEREHPPYMWYFRAADLDRPRWNALDLDGTHMTVLANDDENLSAADEFGDHQRRATCSRSQTPTRAAMTVMIRSSCGSIRARIRSRR